jgi:hypothetical protein
MFDRVLQGTAAVAIEPERHAQGRHPRSNAQLPTREEIARAKQACLEERQRLREAGYPIAEDELEAGLRIANVISAAVYGARGELRK